MILELSIYGIFINLTLQAITLQILQHKQVCTVKNVKQKYLKVLYQPFAL